jgi:shikimate kinase
MGTGKTTVGRVVAHRIGFRCVDSDHEIERSAGKPVAEIFSSEGEAAFRARERQFIEKGHAGERLVVACGGGLVVQDGMIGLLSTKGVVVCLHASIDTILARTGRHARTRPLLDVEDPNSRARALYAEREAVYRSAGTVILTDSRPLSEIAAHVVRVWRRESVDFARRRAP